MLRNMAESLDERDGNLYISAPNECGLGKPLREFGEEDGLVVVPPFEDGTTRGGGGGKKAGLLRNIFHPSRKRTRTRTRTRSEMNTGTYYGGRAQMPGYEPRDATPGNTVLSSWTKNGIPTHEAYIPPTSVLGSASASRTGEIDSAKSLPYAPPQPKHLSPHSTRSEINPGAGRLSDAPPASIPTNSSEGRRYSPYGNRTMVNRSGTPDPKELVERTGIPIGGQTRARDRSRVREREREKVADLKDLMGKEGDDVAGGKAGKVGNVEMACSPAARGDEWWPGSF